MIRTARLVKVRVDVLIKLVEPLEKVRLVRKRVGDAAAIVLGSGGLRR